MAVKGRMPHVRGGGLDDERRQGEKSAMLLSVFELDTMTHESFVLNSIDQQPGRRVTAVLLLPTPALRARPAGGGLCLWHSCTAGLCVANPRCCCHGVWL